MVDGLSLERAEPACSIGHESLSLSGPHTGTKVCLCRLTEDAVPALTLGSVAGDNEIADLVLGVLRADTLNHSSGFVA